MIRASDLRKETRERAGPDWGLGPEKTWKLEKLALPENGLGRTQPTEWFCIFPQTKYKLSFSNT